ncbi:class I SAM-dependent methyltransferase [Bacillus weihaiensis]|nr:class I SAM-dependent methyltransferase [Bacillus weihaiensis]
MKWSNDEHNNWDNKALSWHQNSENMWENGSRKSIIPFFSQYVQKGMNVLDLGCGDGYGSLKLNQIGGYNVIGIDLSPEMIKLALTRKKEGLQFREASILDLPFQANTFDGLLSINCLEWTSDPYRALQNVYSVLREQGKFCIAILGPTAFPREESFFRLYGKRTFCHTIMPWEFERMAIENGWRILDGYGVYKKGVKEDLVKNLSVELKQSLSFMWVFMLEKYHAG